MDTEQVNQMNEESFLSAYNIERYDRPSVATDIAAFSLQTKACASYKKNPEKVLSILLIKRGEHPFMNHWALPGGFLRKDETVEECAIREIEEETNLSPASLFPIHVFSEPDRDPRGRIISHAYASVISEENARIMSGNDAIDAKWFDVLFSDNGDGSYVLTLKRQDVELSSTLKRINDRFGRTEFEIISNDGLAFDHPKIIASAIAALRKEAENLEFIFDFLPEKFTLAALQKVQETLAGISCLSPNFRRKIAEYVEETDEFTEGVGHRPARLFRVKRSDKAIIKKG